MYFCDVIEQKTIYADHQSRFQVQFGENLAGPQGRSARCGLHRSKQRGQIIAHQHAFAASRFGKNIIKTRKNVADKSFLYQSIVVFGRFTWVWFC